MNPRVNGGNNRVFLYSNRTSRIDRVFIEVLRQTRIQIFINGDCSIESDSLFNRE